MSSYGRQLLKRLTLKFCPSSGSSEGVREFIKCDLPALRAQYRGQQVDIKAVEHRGRHPFIEAEYEYANPEKADKRRAVTVGLRNYSREDVLRELWWIKSSQGRPHSAGIPLSHVIRSRPSVQGRWGVDTFGGGGGAAAAAAAAAQSR